ncbi:MAG: FMN-binding protein, partial [Lachnospiraceae bacterium]|nr:FMN-binding protein [Lachnospiraceae bacterium]
MGKQTISRTTLAKGVTACVVVAASLGIIQIGEYSINSSEEAASTAVSSTTGTVAYTPGTYTATAAGIQSDVTVSCTFDEGSITSITVDVSGETAGLGADIGDEMIESFLAAQSSNVDGVSGATITSDALKAALEDCIAQATGSSGGDSDSSEEADEGATEGSISSEEEDIDTTEAESAVEAETDAAVDTEADETEGETEADGNVSETETESEADSEVTAAASDSTAATGSGTYTPGTYTATAAGMESDVTVTVTVDETSILSLGIDVSGETDGIGAAIGTEISEQILNAQSADVDGVSGATVTSTAVKTALADALDQAASSSSVSTDETDTATVVTEDTTEATETETQAAENETVEAETETADTKAVEAETEAADTEAVEAETEAADTEAVEAETEASDTEAVEAETEAADTEAMETETGTETADTEMETAETEATNESAAIEGNSSFVPGTYTASAAGISSDVTVTCTFDETGLVSIEADVSDETAGIGADIGDTMIARVLEAQSSEVDGVSGATITSDAFKAAVADCMEQAGFMVEEAETETESEAESEAESMTTDDDATELAAAADAPFVPGTYTAAAQGMESEITVNVTFDEYNIIAVGTWLEGETDGVGADIGEEISSQILEAQSANVDGVSGATITSTAVKEAVADCIAQAKADSEDTETEAAETETAETETVETETAAADTEAVDESTAIEGGNFVPGTYTASAAGISSDVTVTCTFDETGLVSIEADVSGETAGIGADIGDTMIARVLEAQSSEVDGVSGATITSDAFKAAVADCMEQAGFVAEAAEEETEAESDTDAENVADDDSDSVLAAAADAPFTPGTYTATAQGLESEITVNVTFDEYNIVAVGTWLEGETDGIGADIGEEISDQILEAQSAEIDGVSGATVTSTAVKEAVADCIAQAKAITEEETEEITEAATETETEADTEEMTEAPVETETETAAEETTEADTE